MRSKGKEHCRRVYSILAQKRIHAFFAPAPRQAVMCNASDSQCDRRERLSTTQYDCEIHHTIPSIILATAAAMVRPYRP